MLDAAALRAMKPGAYLVNVASRRSRGRRCAPSPLSRAVISQAPCSMPSVQEPVPEGHPLWGRPRRSRPSSRHVVVSTHARRLQVAVRHATTEMAERGSAGRPRRSRRRILNTSVPTACGTRHAPSAGHDAPVPRRSTAGAPVADDMTRAKAAERFRDAARHAARRADDNETTDVVIDALGAVREAARQSGGCLYLGAGPDGRVGGGRTGGDGPRTAAVGKDIGAGGADGARRPGAVVSTSTKPDVLRATARARGQGRCLLYDPSGTVEAPAGVERVRWSPVSGLRTLGRRLARGPGPGGIGATVGRPWGRRGRGRPLDRAGPGAAGAGAPRRRPRRGRPGDGAVMDRSATGRSRTAGSSIARGRRSPATCWPGSPPPTSGSGAGSGRRPRGCWGLPQRGGPGQTMAPDFDPGSFCDPRPRCIYVPRGGTSRWPHRSSSGC